VGLAIAPPSGFPNRAQNCIPWIISITFPSVHVAVERPLISRARRMADSRRLVVLVSDHALFRDGVSAILRDHGFTVHDGNASSRNRADVVVIDLDHSREDTVALIRRVRRQHEQARIVVIGGALRLAAAQAEAIDAEVETPRVDGDALIAAMTKRAPRLSAEATRARRLWAEVTPRQREVLAWLAGGLDNSAIAAELGVGLRAVKAHVSSLLALFACDSRTQLAMYAQRAGIRARSA
jgi:DNA-binding NarL/FixJ family response regulator